MVPVLPRLRIPRGKGRVTISLPRRLQERDNWRSLVVPTLIGSSQARTGARNGNVRQRIPIWTTRTRYWGPWLSRLVCLEVASLLALVGHELPLGRGRSRQPRSTLL